jgi:hypothetical protein
MVHLEVARLLVDSASLELIILMEKTPDWRVIHVLLEVLLGDPVHRGALSLIDASGRLVVRALLELLPLGWGEVVGRRRWRKVSGA